MARILIAEDEEAIRQILRIICSGQGHQVELAHDGREAMGFLKQQRYDLLITDLRMQPVSGIELARFVRAVCPRTQIMVLTGYADRTSKLQAEKLGVNHFLTKPFNRSQILNAISESSERFCQSSAVA